MGMFGGNKQERLTKRFVEACATGWYDEVERLLKQGVDVNAKDGNGQAVLLLAAYGSYHDVVKALIDRKADVNVRAAKSPWSYTYVISEDSTPLMMSCLRGSYETSELLLASGADLAAKDKHNRTALHYAAASGNFKLVKLLLEKGADPNAVDYMANKPESMAKERGHTGLADFLRDEAARIRENDKRPDIVVAEGWTRTGAEEVTHVSEKKQIGYSLTEIFNFESGVYTRIARNLKTGMESQTMRFFHEFADKQTLEDAHHELVVRGGQSDVSVIYNKGIGKKSPRDLPPPPA